MTELRVGTITNTSGSIPTIRKAALVNAHGVANQTTVGQTLSASFNVASLTDYGVGVTGFNLTSPFFSVATICYLITAFVASNWISTGNSTSGPRTSTTQLDGSHVENNAYYDTPHFDMQACGLMA